MLSALLFITLTADWSLATVLLSDLDAQEGPRESSRKIIPVTARLRRSQCGDIGGHGAHRGRLGATGRYGDCGDVGHLAGEPV